MRERALILVVEDNPTNQLLTSFLLEREGYQVELAESPTAALERLNAHTPDLILMDVQLPGMDGLSFTQTLKAAPETAEIPVIALTAHAMIGDREHAIAVGCADYISKPIDTRTFGEQIRRCLRPAIAGASPTPTARTQQGL